MTMIAVVEHDFGEPTSLRIYTSTNSKRTVSLRDSY